MRRLGCATASPSSMSSGAIGNQPLPHDYPPAFDVPLLWSAHVHRCCRYDVG